MLKILLVDDHHLFRAGLRLMLSEFEPTLECAEAGSCEEALLIADTRSYQLVLLDLHLEGASGTQALRALRQHFESAAVVVLSGEEHPMTIRQCIEAGAAGYIPKSCSPAVMMAALRLVVAGGTYLPPNMLVAMAAAPAMPVAVTAGLGMAPSASAIAEESGHTPTLLTHLTDRQSETLKLAIQGKPNKVIAREMAISEATVKAHLATAFRVLGVRNRTEAVYAAARQGLALPSAGQD